jgi:predicted small lipoprotein YifL
MPRTTLAILVLLGLLAAAGCGQKGPLYLPDDESAAERYAPDDQEAEADEEDD